jgi:succinate dehydrogenase/fumarate reductase-like Fe-S protein
VPVPEGAGWTAMDVLDYIQRRMDGSIGYFRHSACGRGLCRRCAARINGRIGLLCAHIIDGEHPLVLEPISQERRIRDLVCR